MHFQDDVPEPDQLAVVVVSDSEYEEVSAETLAAGAAPPVHDAMDAEPVAPDQDMPRPVGNPIVYPAVGLPPPVVPAEEPRALLPPGGHGEPDAEPGYALPSPAPRQGRWQASARATVAPNPSVVAGDSSGGSSALAVAAGASAGGSSVPTAFFGSLLASFNQPTAKQRPKASVVTGPPPLVAVAKPPAVLPDLILPAARSPVVFPVITAEQSRAAAASPPLPVGPPASADVRLQSRAAEAPPPLRVGPPASADVRLQPRAEEPPPPLRVGPPASADVRLQPQAAEAPPPLTVAAAPKGNQWREPPPPPQTPEQALQQEIEQQLLASQRAAAEHVRTTQPAQAIFSPVLVIPGAAN